MEPIADRKIKEIYVKHIGWQQTFGDDPTWIISYSPQRATYLQNNCEYSREAVIAVRYF